MLRATWWIWKWILDICNW